ncbi:rhodanese-like domain-containing protein [Sedimenticola hydrogenitrophicus]|uniref:rhodanese-like domain-containing protein n=1 Tax=Sedimenticola hydrogenitrophicus TaxID=2967975 RepID=UPI0023AED08E|nr:rhodanese-like domain-containing protein [Sedimenticola hydrogenitrophicus]
MKYGKVSITLALIGGVALAGLAMAGPMAKITPGMESLDVVHNGKTVTIRRVDDKDATIPAAYNHPSRHCPPFCIQPMHLIPGVDTIGELDVLGYLKRISNGDRSVMLVDSRTPDWTRRGTIPGAVNIPWDKINIDVAGNFEIETEAETLSDILVNSFGVQMVDGKWDFRKAKTLVLFCNGIWCPQSSVNIKTLTKMGYPAYKLKWYRGGMQDWVSVGLTTVMP